MRRNPDIPSDKQGQAIVRKGAPKTYALLTRLGFEFGCEPGGWCWLHKSVGGLLASQKHLRDPEAGDPEHYADGRMLHLTADVEGSDDSTYGRNFRTAKTFEAYVSKVLVQHKAWKKAVR